MGGENATHPTNPFMWGNYTHKGVLESSASSRYSYPDQLSTALAKSTVVYARSCLLAIVRDQSVPSRPPCGESESQRDLLKEARYRQRRLLDMNEFDRRLALPIPSEMEYESDDDDDTFEKNLLKRYYRRVCIFY